MLSINKKFHHPESQKPSTDKVQHKHTSKTKTALIGANETLRINTERAPLGFHRMSSNERKPLLFLWFAPGVHTNQFEPWKPSLCQPYRVIIHRQAVLVH